MTAVAGGCLCGTVRYTVARSPTAVFLCYCQQCQKAQGTPFVASVPVARVDFQITQGGNRLKAFRASASKSRYFCGDRAGPNRLHSGPESISGFSADV
ncbi:MAG: GFA family protein [Gammaproteobacteria bacterium]|nr:GFA family protein [Gammaproteobacteria bacterium]